MKLAIGANLHRLRTERGLSLAELSRRSKVAKARLVALENGGANPTVETLVAIADALGVSTASLFEDSHEAQQLVRADEGERAEGQFGAVRILDRIEGALAIDVVEAVLKDGVPFIADEDHAGHAPGTSGMSYVLEGRLLGGTRDAPQELRAGDYMRWPIDRPYFFQAVGGPARVLSLIVSSRPGTFRPMLGMEPAEAAKPPKAAPKRRSSRRKAQDD